jgi:hypothetical protein
VRETGAAASCVALTPAEQLARVRLVFVGLMLPGPSTRLGGRRVLGSPARARVTRYLKGHGPKTVRVDTAVRIDPHGVTGREDGIEPRPGSAGRSTRRRAASRLTPRSAPGARA